jgi:hypothetical protein
MDPLIEALFQAVLSEMDKLFTCVRFSRFLPNGVAVNMSRPPALDRAAIDAKDQSEPSSPNPVTLQSAPRSQRGRRGVHESAAAVASRGFRLLKIRSGATTYGLINHAALSSPEISGPTRSQTQIRFGGEHPPSIT